MFYKKTSEGKLCFSSVTERGGNVMEVADEEYMRLVSDATARGSLIQIGKNNKPELVTPPLTEEQINEYRRLRRFLEQTDWYVIRYAETGKAIPDDIRAKRQDARDGISRLMSTKA
jgi:hypothetical protein